MDTKYQTMDRTTRHVGQKSTPKHNDTASAAAAKRRNIAPDITRIIRMTCSVVDKDDDHEGEDSLSDGDAVAVSFVEEVGGGTVDFSSKRNFWFILVSGGIGEKENEKDVCVLMQSKRKKKGLQKRED